MKSLFARNINKVIAIISPATDVKISTAKVNATITPNQNELR